MANPKRKISKSKRDMKRQQWTNKLSSSDVTVCENCGSTKLSHRVCPDCGFYRGKQITAGNE